MIVKKFRDFSLSLVYQKNISLDDLNRIKASGFNYVDLNPSLIGFRDLQEVSPVQLYELKTMLKISGTKANSIQGLFFGIEASSLNNAKLLSSRVRRLAEVALEINCTSLVFGSPNLRVLPMWQDLLNISKSICDEYNVSISVENICTQRCVGSPESVFFNSDMGEIGKVFDYSNFLECLHEPKLEDWLDFEYDYAHISGNSHQIPSSEDQESEIVNVLGKLKVKRPISFEILGLSVDEILCDLNIHKFA